MNETLVATTRRAITFGVTGPDTVRRDQQTHAAGTEVYVTRIRDNGSCRIRIPGTLLEQTVRITDVEPA
jgi:hypothetical protein